MTWNYRIVRFSDPEWYQIHEVHYDSSGEPTSMTARSVCLEGESKDDIEKEIALIMRAFREPILDADELPWMKSTIE